MAKFQDILDSLNEYINQMTKQAEQEVSDENVLSGDLRDYRGPGDKVSKKKQKEKTVKVDGSPKDFDEEDIGDGTDYLVEDEQEYQDAQDKIKEAADNGYNLLAQIERALKKRAEDESEEEEGEEETEEEEEAPEEESGEESVEEEPTEEVPEEEAPEEAEEEAPELTPEDKEVLEALGVTAPEEKQAYLISKQAGYKFADHILKEQRKLFKKATAELIHNNPGMLYSHIMPQNNSDNIVKTAALLSAMNPNPAIDPYLLEPLLKQAAFEEMLKEAIDLSRARTILDGLLAKQIINEAEKQAIMNQLGGLEALNENTLAQIANLAARKDLVYKALEELLPPAVIPQEQFAPSMPISQPQIPAENPIAENSAEKAASLLKAAELLGIDPLELLYSSYY